MSPPVRGTGLSQAAAAFHVANSKSPVVSGYVHGQGGEGATYTLKNGLSFKLNAVECSQVAPIQWANVDLRIRK